MVEPTGFEPATLADRRITAGYPTLGKRASLLGPPWLFQCIRNPCARDTGELAFTPTAFRFCDRLRRPQAGGPIVGADGEPRTLMHEALAPKASVSTDSTTSAIPCPGPGGANEGARPGPACIGAARECRTLTSPGHRGLKPARLPIPPSPHDSGGQGEIRTPNVSM